MNLCAWILSILTLLCAVFGWYPFYQTNPQTTSLEFGLFVALSEIAWPIAVCYIIFACARGYGGPINSLLSHPLWQPFSKLSYAVYLIHDPLIQVVSSTNTVEIFEELKTFQLFIEVCALSVLLAIPATLAFVSPLDTIDKLIFSTNKKPKTPNTMATENPVK